MTRTHAIRRATVVALLLTLAALLVGPPALAAPGQVITVDVTGDVFTCTGGTTYTVTSGSIRIVYHESTDANGGFHVTSTIVPQGVRLASSADRRTYYLSGAAWFGANFRGAGGEITDTEHFVIRAASGGAVAKVSITAHFTMNAQGVLTVTFDKDTGACHAPEG